MRLKSMVVASKASFLFEQASSFLNNRNWKRNTIKKMILPAQHIWTLSSLLDTFFSRENCCFWLRIIIERSFMVFVVQNRMTRLWKNWKIIVHTQNDVVLSCWQSSCVEWQKIMILCEQENMETLLSEYFCSLLYVHTSCLHNNSRVSANLAHRN